MATLATLTLKRGVITKIVTAETEGWIRDLTRTSEVFWTWRATGGSAPTEEEISDEGALLFPGPAIDAEIDSPTSIDVYAVSLSADSKIRTDLP